MTNNIIDTIDTWIYGFYFYEGLFHFFNVSQPHPISYIPLLTKGGGPRVVVSTAAFHARVRGSVPGLGGLKETKIVSSPSTCES